MSEGCTREGEALRATRGDDWSEELRVHVDGCADCRDVSLVAGLLQREATLAEEEVGDSGLLPADLAWLRADVARRRAEADTLSRRLRRLDRLVWGAGAVAAMGALVAGHEVVGALLRAGRGAVGELVEAARSADPHGAFWGVTVALAALVVVAFHNLWAEQA